jgi:hypothetical protein
MVGSPAARRDTTWSRRIPATWTRWSSRFHHSPHTSRNSQSPQWSTGYGSVAAAPSMAVSKASRTRR